MKIRGILRQSLALIALVAIGCGSAWAQGLQDIKINEILVNNSESYIDDHGAHCGWVELYNSGYSNVNIGGAYLTVRHGDATRTYRIPKNDARTLLPPQGYVIFFADSSSNRGTFHTNFTLSETGYLALLDQGKNVVDSAVYNVAAQKTDVSIGRLVHPDKSITFETLGGITPMQANELEELMPASEKFRMLDPYGIVMAITAMSVVFIALVVLVVCFKSIGRTMVRSTQRKERKEISTMPEAVQKVVKAEGDLIGEEIAAIAMALRKYEADMHDIESNVLTINRVARVYSPWSSKIYGLQQTPDRRR